MPATALLPCFSAPHRADRRKRLDRTQLLSMISNKETAKQVEQTMRQCSAALNESIRLVNETCSEEEFKAYRRVIAEIMADIFLEVMQPIHRRFPELEPEELRRPS